MSSYLSNILTSTTSRYNSLRRTLLDNEADGDTEDDTHISRVLRAYYAEKGRPLPPWLPPDPNDRRATTPQPSYGAQASNYFTGRNQAVQSMQQAGSRASGGGLGDLWDKPGPQAAAQQPQSLRAGRRPAPQAASNLAPPTSAAQARPLPSQRAGSYQSFQSQHTNDSSPSSAPGSSAGGGAGAGTAQERLKQRLWGGARAGSPLPSPGLNEPTRNPYEQADAGGGGGSGNSRRYGRFGTGPPGG